MADLLVTEARCLPGFSSVLLEYVELADSLQRVLACAWVTAYRATLPGCSSCPPPLASCCVCEAMLHLTGARQHCSKANTAAGAVQHSTLAESGVWMIQQACPAW